jgi:hypothetical protein
MPQLPGILANSSVLYPLLVWSIIWKGFALWIAAKRNEKLWFAVLVILNTFGIVEIIYIFFIAKKNLSDAKDIFK